MNSQKRIQKVSAALLAMQRASWEQGVTAQAFLELGEMDTVVLLAKAAAMRQLSDGRLAGMYGDSSVNDPAANGEPLIRAAELTGDEMLERAWKAQLNWLMEIAPRSEEGTLMHILPRPEIWVDSIYMAPPFLAAAGEAEEAVRQIEGHRKVLWDKEAMMYSHIWDSGAKEFRRKAHWGVGNGWAATGITRVMRLLPDSMADSKKRLAGYVKEVLDGCLGYIREDGLFHDVVDDTDTFVETNLGQMLAYSIYRGVSRNWLDESYLSAAEKMYHAASDKVDAWGCVRGVCGAPGFDHAGVAPEGQAFYLLMEAARRDGGFDKK